MKDRLSIAAVAICVVSSILCMCLFCLPERRAVDIEVLPAAIQDIGFVRQATETTANYTLCNRASVPIQILAASTSCGCTGVEFPDQELAPGESAPLTLKFDSGASRGFFSVRAMMTYRKGGESQPYILPIGLKAEIDPEYDVEPERLQFRSKGPLVQRVTLSSRHISELKISEPVCNLRFFTAKILATKNTNQPTVEVAFNPDGYYRDAGFGELRIPTNCERQPLLRIPIEVIDENATSIGIVGQ